MKLKRAQRHSWPAHRVARLVSATRRAGTASGAAAWHARTEKLEDRVLLAATPLITEFLAVNATGITDGDGDHSDWIEVYNPAASAIDLSGCYLTDDSGNLTKWQFPAGTPLTDVPGSGYALVFASGKDKVTSTEMHTNFSLSVSGEYLALVAPDGVTVLSQYHYPEQVADVSYGQKVVGDQSTYISTNGTVKVTVPTGDIGTDWNTLNYDDTAWPAGSTGVGFDSDNTPVLNSGFDVHMIDTAGGTDGNFSNIIEAQSVLNGTAGGAFTIFSDTSGSYSNINFGASQGNFANDNLLPNGFGTTGDSGDPQREQYTLRITADVTIPVGTWTINVNSDDGFMLRLPGISFSSRSGQNFTGTGWNSSSEPHDTLVYSAPRGPNNSLGTFTVTGSPLSTTLTLDYYEAGGGDNVDLSLVNASTGTFDANSFKLLSDGQFGWQVKTQAGAPVDYGPLISTNIQGSMLNHNATAYLRMPFTTNDPTAADYLTLRMKYDDGFIAYLNGVEIARRNAPDNAVWNSAATASQNDLAAIAYEDINIPVPEDPNNPGMSLLQEGANVLAIQALNASASDPDLLIYPELYGVHVTSVSEQYFGTPTPGSLNNDSNMEAVADTQFSVNRGFFTSPFFLTISCKTDGATIRYTTDGTAPTATSGTVYTGPVWVNATSVIRAAAFKTGWLSTNVDTNTYIFPADVASQSIAGTTYGSLPSSWSPNTTDYGMDQRIARPEPSYVVYNGRYVFAASDDQTGLELWWSDGTAGGTTMIKDIWPGPRGSGPSDFVVFNNQVYFRADDGASGSELWVTNGTTAGTHIVGDLYGGGGTIGGNGGTYTANSSYPSSLTVVGSVLYFTAYSPTYGYEVYAYDGSTFPSSPIRDITSGSGASYPSNLTSGTYAGLPTLYFTATSGSNNYELWRSDTTSGAVQVSDINPSGSSFPMGLTAIGGTLYFSATDGTHGVELWETNGTSATTSMVLDIAPDAMSSYPSNLINVAGTLYFSAGEPLNGLELWRTDGTTAGTVLVKNIAPGSTGSDLGNFVALGSSLFFTANDGVNGNELWTSNGTGDGTMMVIDIVPNGGSSSPGNLTVSGATLYFTASSADGRELWRSDGSAATTAMVTDLAPGAPGSNPQYLAAGQPTVPLYFTATVAGVTGVYRSDGTPGGTVLARAVNVGSPATLQTSDLLSISTFSVAVAPADMFGPNGFYSNPSWDGRASERPASLELINPDGTVGFQVNAGIRTRGGYSRSTGNPKHGFRFFFRGVYGDSKLEYPLFGPDGADVFNGFDLRTFQNYSWSFEGDPRGIFLRDQLNRDLQINMGQPGSHGNFYYLYINGMFFGLYDIDERPEADFGATYFGGRAEDYDTIKVNPAAGYTIYATDGDMVAWTDLWYQLNDSAISTLAGYMKVQGKNPDGTVNPNYADLLDVDNLIDYMLGIFWADNLDAPLSNFLSNNRPNNFFAVRNRTGSSGGFKFFQHDGEHTLFTWGDARDNRTGPYNTFDPNPANSLQYSNPQFMFQLLLSNPEFRLRVADRINKHMLMADGALYPDNISAQMNQRIAEVDRAAVAESARWGDSKRPWPMSRNVDWLNEVNRIAVDDYTTAAIGDSWIDNRTGIVFNQLLADSLYPTYGASVVLSAPSFDKLGGTYDISTPLNISNLNPGGILYFTTDGSDPRLIGGTGGPRGDGSSASASVYSGALALTQTTTVKARILYNGTWSALTEETYTVNLASLRVSELMYAPPALASDTYPTEDYEYIELVNTSGSAMNIAGVRIADAVTFTFPADAEIAANGRVIVARNPDAFRERYGDSIPVFGPYTGQLSNGGELFTLQAPAPSDVVVEQFTYGGGWYNLVDGGGYSLVAIDPNASSEILSSKEGWRPSDTYLGGPGVADPGVNPGTVIINEALTHTDLPSGDWIELRNTTGEPVDISGWFLSDSAADLTKYQIAQDTVIPANGTIVFTQSRNFGSIDDPGMHSPFALSEFGDDVYLSNNDGAGNPAGYRDEVHFAGADSDVTFGRYFKSTGGTDFVAMQQPTYDAPNAAPVVGPVVFSELSYDPTNAGYEFIELRNISGSTVQLHDNASPVNAWQFTSGVTFTFPDNAEIAPYGYVILTDALPADFRTRYPSVPADVPVYQYTGSLSNSGETVELSRPGVINAGEPVPWIVVDSVKYSDSGSWPAGATNSDRSIYKLSPGLYSNDASNWALGPVDGTPGTQNNLEAPTVDAGAARAVVNQGATFTRSGSFADGDPQSWNGVVNYGDGSGDQALALTPSKTFSLSHVYAGPGTYTITVSIADSSSAVGTQQIIVYVLPTGTRTGQPGANTITLRRDPSTAFTQFFENVPTTGAPTFSIPTSVLNAISYSTGASDDAFIIDMTFGDPLGPQGATLDAGAGTDTLTLTGTPFADAFTLAGGNVFLDGIITLATSAVESLTLNAAGGNDLIAITDTLPMAAALNGGAGNDKLSIDLSTVGAVLPEAGVAFDGGEGSDSAVIVGRAGLAAGYAQGAVSGNAAVEIAGNPLMLASNETTTMLAFDSLAVTLPSAGNDLTLSPASDPGTTTLSGLSGGSALAPLVFASTLPVTLSGPQGADAIHLDGAQATLAITNPSTALSGSSGTLTIITPMTRLQGIDLSGTARVNLAPGSDSLLRTGSLALVDNAILDAADNDLIVDYAGSSPMGDLRQWIANGQLGAAGPSILSSQPDPSPGHPGAFGAVDNSMLHLGEFSGETLSGFSQVLIKYTYQGDTNLDGKVTQADFANVLANLGRSGATWFDGDLDNDGNVTVADFALVSANLGAGDGVTGGPILAVAAAAPSLAEATPVSTPRATSESVPLDAVAAESSSKIKNRKSQIENPIVAAPGNEPWSAVAPSPAQDNQKPARHHVRPCELALDAPADKFSIRRARK